MSAAKQTKSSVKAVGNRDALARSEESLRELISDVEDYAIFLLDPEGHVASWNAAAERIKGYRADEIVGRHFSAFYTPEDLAKGWPEKELLLAAENGRSADEGWRVRQDGSLFWASVVITALRGHERNLQGFLKITRDLTEHKQAEEELRRSEERFRLMVEAVQDYAIFVLDPQGHVSSWNAGAERIKGYKAKEILGKHFSVFYPPEALAAGKPEWELKTAIAQGRIEDEGWRLRKDGTRFWANIVITAMIDKNGKHVGFAKVTRDMTDRRKVEELQEAHRQKDEFLALLAHELRNPLAPIRSALHVMKQPGVDASVAHRAHEIAERQVSHMSRLLDDLLDLSRISLGRIELRKEILDVASVVQAAVDAVRPLLAQRRHRLTVAVPPGTLWVDADPTRLEQVLSNLLNNAAKYTDPGGEISVTGERKGADVMIRVQDSGIGIDAAMLPWIFDLFVQAERRLDNSVGGVGVGLSLVKRLVELHGGFVFALSPGRGKGSEFLVRLPGAEAPSRGQDRVGDPKSRRSNRQSLRILVADDNVDGADGLAMLLEMAGDEVRTAYEGPSVLTIAQSFQPHVVLLDIGMPGMDGYEVAQRLRSAPETRHALLLAMTGWGRDEDRQKAKDSGFDHHLTKPFDPAVLEMLLADHRKTRC
jgi:PAS domain S-box-containing protein